MSGKFLKERAAMIGVYDIDIRDDHWVAVLSDGTTRDFTDEEKEIIDLTPRPGHPGRGCCEKHS